MKAVIALLLTFAAGLVDVAGFMKLYQVFTAHMTGVTVHLGNDIVHRLWDRSFMGAVVLISFVGGSILGRSMIEVSARYRFRRVATISLFLEAALIATVAAGYKDGAHHGIRIWFLVMLATSMGLQTATLTRVGPLNVHTTFVTGMLNKLAQLLSHAVFHQYDCRRDPARKAQRNEVLRQAGFIFSIWVLYLGGAITGGLLTLSIGLRCLFIAVGILVIAIVADHFHPLSLQEERDEDEPTELNRVA